MSATEPHAISPSATGTAPGPRRASRSAPQVSSTETPKGAAETAPTPAPGGRVRPRYTLVNDELITIPYGGRPARFCLRIWRAPDGPAILLVSRLAGEIGPGAVSSRLLNLAAQAYLGSHDVQHFEQDGEQFRFALFDWCGPEDRCLYLPDPVYGAIDRDFFEGLIGCPVE